MATCRDKSKDLQRIKSGELIHENNNLTEEERANNAFKYFEQIWMFTNNIWYRFAIANTEKSY